jgi:hypothetical protein
MPTDPLLPGTGAPADPLTMREPVLSGPPGPFLTRYLAGDHEAVWADLLALGPAVRDPAVLPDAWRVACETMHRVRQGVEMIHRRLAEAMHGNGHIYTGQTPPPDSGETLAEVERLIGGPLPLSLRAFYLITGGIEFEEVDPEGMPEWVRPYLRCEPLRVCGVGDVLFEVQEEFDCRAYEAGVPFSDLAGWDGWWKPDEIEWEPTGIEVYKDAGGHPILTGDLPDPSADTASGLLGGTFVNFLRRALRNGGLVNPDDEARPLAAKLSEGLPLF